MLLDKMVQERHKYMWDGTTDKHDMSYNNNMKKTKMNHQFP